MWYLAFCVLIPYIIIALIYQIFIFQVVRKIKLCSINNSCHSKKYFQSYTLSSKTKELLRKWVWHTCNKAFAAQREFQLKLLKYSITYMHGLVRWWPGSLCRWYSIDLYVAYKYMYRMLDLKIRKIQICKIIFLHIVWPSVYHFICD